MIKMTQGRSQLAAKLLGCASATAMAAGLLAAAPANALVTPETRGANAPGTVDTNNTRPYWVGIGIRNAAGTGGGTCTGLLINPRTVLFAAHCVDDTAMAQYNAAGSRAAVAYTMDPTFGIGNLRQWLFGNQANGQPQAGSDGRSVTAESVSVFYHPQALNNSSNGGTDLAFLSADIAYAAFGTAVDLGRNNANTLGLLFSPVDRLVNVTIGGYGQSGNGLTGTRQSDFRRRLGTNVLGFLGSDRDVTLGVYGGAPNANLIIDFFDPAGPGYQDQYWLDFDDPLRGTRNPADPFDFDVFPGNATSLESLTAAGDSGSPLVTGDYGREVSLGVLSQGSRYFYGSSTAPFFAFPAFSNYGTTSGYNPLFLFWDFIVANNPYKYASIGSTAATVEWSDAAAWVETLDPNYFVLQNGQLVNALPTTGALGVSTATPNLGTVRANPNPLPACAITNGCPQGPNTPPGGVVDAAQMPDAVGATVDATTTVATPANSTAAGTVSTAAVPARGSIEGVASRTTMGSVQGNPSDTTMGGSVQGNPSDTTMGGAVQGNPSDTTMAGSVGGAPGSEAQNVQGAWSVRPGSAPASGPGSTGFTPNNQNGTSGVFNSARFFEVTLNRAGQTINLSANNAFANNTVNIDRLNLSGATTTLNIASGARLNTAIRSYVDAGTLNVNGTFAPSALDILGGRLQGTGTVLATGGIRNTGGTISGGGTNAAGTLSITGPVTISGAGALGIDIVSATSADRVNVTGALTLGGIGMVNAVGSYVPVWNTSWVVASGTTVTGSFGSVASNLPGVLIPVFSTANNQVTLRIDARPFSQAVSPVNDSQAAAARTLDSARAGNYAALKPVYDRIDVLAAADARRALGQLNANDGFLARQNTRAQANFINEGLSNRMSVARSGGQGVTMAGLAPTLFAAGTPDALMAMSPIDAQVAQDTAEKVGGMKAGYGLFLDVRRLEGDTFAPTGDTGDLENSLVTVGLDKLLTDNILVGGAVSYAWGDSTSVGLLADSDSKTFAASIYASYFNRGLFIDYYASYGQVDQDTSRQVLGFTLEGENDGRLIGFGLGAGYDVKLGNFGVIPEVRYDLTSIKYDAYSETGGTPALQFGKTTVVSNQIRAGATVYGEFATGEGQAIIPKFTLFRVQEILKGNDALVNPVFTGAPNVVLNGQATGRRDTNWFEIGGGLSFKASDNLEVSVSYEESSGRYDIKTKSYVGSMRLKF